VTRALRVSAHYGELVLQSPLDVLDLVLPFAVPLALHAFSQLRGDDARRQALTTVAGTVVFIALFAWFRVFFGWSRLLSHPYFSPLSASASIPLALVLPLAASLDDARSRRALNG
jgi:hypothetical protein